MSGSLSPDFATGGVVAAGAFPPPAGPACAAAGDVSTEAARVSQASVSALAAHRERWKNAYIGGGRNGLEVTRNALTATPSTPVHRRPARDLNHDRAMTDPH